MIHGGPCDRGVSFLRLSALGSLKEEAASNRLHADQTVQKKQREHGGHSSLHVTSLEQQTAILRLSESILGRPNRSLAFDRLLDSSCQGRFSYIRWPSILNEKKVVLARQLRPILIFTTF